MRGQSTLTGVLRLESNLSTAPICWIAIGCLLKFNAQARSCLVSRCCTWLNPAWNFSQWIEVYVFSLDESQLAFHRVSRLQSVLWLYIRSLINHRMLVRNSTIWFFMRWLGHFISLCIYKFDLLSIKRKFHWFKQTWLAFLVEKRDHIDALITVLNLALRLLNFYQRFLSGVFGHTTLFSNVSFLLLLGLVVHCQSHLNRLGVWSLCVGSHGRVVSLYILRQAALISRTI